MPAPSISVSFTQAPSKEELARQAEAATRLQAAQRGINQRKRSWVDQELKKAGAGPLTVPTGPTAEGYPLYCISIAKFLELDEWVPHQDALEKGLLELYDPATMDEKLIFISHQWTSWYHPDPAGEQREALQYSLKKLIEGETDVRSNPQLEMNYGLYLNHKGEWWKKNLPEMYLWIDYFSMPQPLAAKFKGKSREEIEAAMAEEKRARHAGMVETAAADDEATAPTAAERKSAAGDEPKSKRKSVSAARQRHAGMDHRAAKEKESEVAKLVEQLTKAVDCIPNYIQNCDMMWVLVPPIKHADVDGAICDFATWRNRGWCRMEFKASKLKCGKDMPCMIIAGRNSLPFYVNPCDQPRLNPANGDFSVEEDRPKVMEVLNSFYAMKAQSYLAMGDLAAFRMAKLFRALTTEPYRYTDEEKAVDGAAAIARVKAAMAWRDEATEEAWMKKHKLSLLMLAVLMNDEPAVKALLAQPDAAASLAMKAGAPWKAKEVRTHPHRKEPFVGLINNIKGMTPLVAAIPCADHDVLTLVLAAKPPAPTMPSGMQGLMIALMLGHVDAMKLFADAYPDCNIFDKAIMMGMTWTHMYAMACQGPDQCQKMDFFNERTKNKFVGTYMPMGMTALHMTAHNTEIDAAVVSELVRKGADLNAVDKMPKLLLAIANLGSRLGSKKMSSFKRMLEPLNMKGTPLHHAALKGNLMVVDELVKCGADVDAKDKYGKTPLERAAEGVPGNPPGTGITPLANTPTYEVLQDLLATRRVQVQPALDQDANQLFA